VRGRLGILAVLTLAGCRDGDSAQAPTATPAQRACTEIGCAPEGVELDFQRIPSGNVEVVLCVEDRSIACASR
jgi:hypothetical protein